VVISANEFFIKKTDIKHAALPGTSPEEHSFAKAPNLASAKSFCCYNGMFRSTPNKNLAGTRRRATATKYVWLKEAFGCR